MSNLLKTELYKLFHSWYFWGIGIFNLLLSSILLLDSKERSSNLIMASLYNIPLTMDVYNHVSETSRIESEITRLESVAIS